MLAWWRHRKAYQRLVAADAATLIEAWGMQAYEEARRRIHADREGKVIDADRPKGHWDEVRRRIKEGAASEYGLDLLGR